MGAMTNNGRKLANFAGFYKGIQSAGAAIIWRLDGLHNPPSYMALFASSWGLLAGSLLIAAPVMLWKIKVLIARQYYCRTSANAPKDTVPIEDDVKFSDETVAEVIGHKTIVHDGLDGEKV